MYGNMQAAASYHQHELLHEVEANRAAREVAGLDGHSSQHHQLIVAAVAVLLALVAIAVI